MLVYKKDKASDYFVHDEWIRFDEIFSKLFFYTLKNGRTPNMMRFSMELIGLETNVHWSRDYTSMVYIIKCGDKKLFYIVYGDGQRVISMSAREDADYLATILRLGI